MNALALQNPRHRCDWETRMTTDKKIIMTITVIFSYTVVII